MSEGSKGTTVWALVFCAWLVAAVSTLGALFMGEVMGITPCVLCWYQRIAMFPLVLVLGLGLFPLDARVVRYALPLAVCGVLLASYHVLLTWGVIPEAMAPCVQGVPCGRIQVQWLGFITIPLLAFAAFLTINLLLIAAALRKAL